MGVGLVATLVKDCGCSSVRATTRVVILESVLHLTQNGLPVPSEAALQTLLANLALDLFLGRLHLGRGAERASAAHVAIVMLQLRLV